MDIRPGDGCGVYADAVQPQVAGAAIPGAELQAPVAGLAGGRWRTVAKGQGHVLVLRVGEPIGVYGQERVANPLCPICHVDGRQACTGGRVIRSQPEDGLVGSRSKDARIRAVPGARPVFSSTAEPGGTLRGPGVSRQDTRLMVKRLAFPRPALTKGHAAGFT